MATNNKAIQVLRGPRQGIIDNADQKLLPGQPLFITDDNYLVLGDGNSSVDSNKPIAVREVKGYFDDIDTSTKKYKLSQNTTQNYYLGPNTNNNALQISSDNPIEINANKITLAPKSGDGEIILDAKTVTISGQEGVGNQNQSLASIINRVSENESKIQTLTEYKTDADNRFTSIEQTADADRANIIAAAGIASDNADAIASLQSEVTPAMIKEKLSAELAKVDSLEEGQKELAETIQQVMEDGSAMVSQMVSQVSNFTYLKDIIWDPADKDPDKIYMALDRQDTKTYKYYYYKDGDWVATLDPIKAGCQVTAAGIVTAINASGDTSTKISADSIELDGIVTFINSDKNTTTIDGSKITAGTIKLQSDDIEGFNDKVTTITNDTLSTTNVVAQNLQINAGNIQNLTASSIKVTDDANSETLATYLDNELKKELTSTSIKYGKGNSDTTYSDIANWYDNQIDLENLSGTYLWQKITKTFSNGSNDETYICLGRAGSITVTITSNIGVFCDVDDDKITLKVKVEQDKKDITSHYAPDAFVWTKYTTDGQVASWVPSYTDYTHTEIEISVDDINKLATYNCEVDLTNLKKNQEG